MLTRGLRAVKPQRHQRNGAGRTEVGRRLTACSVVSLSQTEMASQVQEAVAAVVSKGGSRTPKSPQSVLGLLQVRGAASLSGQRSG